MQILYRKERTCYSTRYNIAAYLSLTEYYYYVKTNQAPSSYLAECHLVVQWTGVSAVVEWEYQDLKLVKLVELRQQVIAGLVQRL